MAAAAGEPGQRVGGRYRLEALIGEGGMAQVWRATDTTLERVVALKLLLARDDRSREAIEERFLREARLAAAAHHPNVVQVLDFGTDGGRPYMVMEMLDGESLEERLLRPPTLTVGQLAPIIVQTLEGLALVHELGIIHRDLKPSNIFLARGQNGAICPKLIDFGISRSVGDGPGSRHSPFTTREGFFVGTPEYMSPEQARGLPTIDQRTDIFSVGVMLYEALTGRLPFETPNVGDLLILIATAEAPTVRSVRPELGEAISNVVARAMQKDPSERWSSALAMRDALIDAAAATTHPSLPVLAPPPATDATGPQETQRSRSDAPTLDGRAPAPVAASLVPPGSIAPRPARESSRRWIVAAAAVAATGFLLSGLVIAAVPTPSASPVAQPPRSVPAAEPASAPGAAAAAHAPASPVQASAPRAERTPPVPPLEPVIVHLTHLPDNATVLVDGRPIVDRMPTMPRDGAAHAIEVWVAGSPIWRTVHRASADGAYEVVVAAAAPPGTARPPATSGAAGRRPRPGARRGAGGAADDSFRVLDY